MPTSKQMDLEASREHPERADLTTDQGIPISHTDDSLKAGTRGPSLLEDFHLREKITRFDHERIPERVVHARGSGAHGVFRVYESPSENTTAVFLCDSAARIPVFVRFPMVVGPRGPADTARHVNGFATRFYTRQGNFDLVGNNMPVFFIQDDNRLDARVVDQGAGHEGRVAATRHTNNINTVSTDGPPSSPSRSAMGALAY